MWTIVIITGLGMAIDPVRIALAIVIMSQRRAFRNLMAFWLGGVAMGLAIGLSAFVLMREFTLGALHFVGDTFTYIRTTTVIFMGGRLHIAIGLLALLMLALMTKRARATARLNAGGGHTVTLVEERPSNLFQRMGARTQEILSGDRLWPAFFVGLSSSFPPYEGWVIVTVILASGAAVTTQFSALMVFMLLVLAVVEIPLVCYLAVPAKTYAVMERIQDWLRTYRLQITQTIVGFTGVILIFQGIARL